MKKCAVMWGFDGTLLDSMGLHAELAARLMSEKFKVSFDLAKKMYLETTGIPFDKQLKIIFPNAHFEMINECIKEYYQRKIVEVYGRAENFPETIATLEAVCGRFPNCIQIISSSTEEEIIYNWAVSHFGMKYFVGILGRESGSKIDHINQVTRLHPLAEIVFVSDSAGDMNLLPAGCLGVNVPPESVYAFRRSNAYSFTEKPINPEWIIDALELILCE